MGSRLRADSLTLPELHEIFLEDLGSCVTEQTGDISKKPLYLTCGKPLYCKLKPYLFNCTNPPGGRSLDEYKIQLIIDNQRRGERGVFVEAPQETALIVGFVNLFSHPEDGVYVLWEVAMHQNFAYSANLQVKLEYILETSLKNVVVYQKKKGMKSRGEVMVLANRRHLIEAIQTRMDIDLKILLKEPLSCWLS